MQWVFYLSLYWIQFSNINFSKPNSENQILAENSWCWDRPWQRTHYAVYGQTLCRRESALSVVESRLVRNKSVRVNDVISSLFYTDYVLSKHSSQGTSPVTQSHNTWLAASNNILWGNRPQTTSQVALWPCCCPCFAHNCGKCVVPRRRVLGLLRLLGPHGGRL